MRLSVFSCCLCIRWFVDSLVRWVISRYGSLSWFANASALRCPQYQSCAGPRMFSRIFSGMFTRTFSQNDVLGEPTGPICRRFGKFRLFPPGANGRVKTSRGRFNASVLACASRTDLVVRISEGLQIARSRIATYYSEAKRIN